MGWNYLPPEGWGTRPSQRYPAISFACAMARSLTRGLEKVRLDRPTEGISSIHRLTEPA